MRIGRTSFRLRNAANRAPSWAAAAIEQRVAEEQVRVHRERGELAALFPIRLQPQCTLCHGDPATLAEPVRAALQRDYPDDRATGFAPGDLRGWFWIEVE